MAGQGARVYKRDGLDMAQALCPPTPRRGVLMVDPSYEVKSDYERCPRALGQIARKWNVGVLVLWYPILRDGPHAALTSRPARRDARYRLFRGPLPPARPGHRMIGSGWRCCARPGAWHEEAARIAKLLENL